MLSGYPGMPQMLTPPGAPSMPGQGNPSVPGQANPLMPGQANPSIPGQVNNGVPRPMTMNPQMMVPGSSGIPTSGAPPMFAPTMYQANPTPQASGGFESTNINAQAQDSDH